MDASAASAGAAASTSEGRSLLTYDVIGGGSTGLPFWAATLWTLLRWTLFFAAMYMTMTFDVVATPNSKAYQRAREVTPSSSRHVNHVTNLLSIVEDPGGARDVCAA